MRKLNYKKELLRIFYTCGQVRILYIIYTIFLSVLEKYTTSIQCP